MFPTNWIAENGHDVTDDFVQCAKPLIGQGMLHLPMINGRQRLTRLQPIFADQKLPPCALQADRTTD